MTELIALASTLARHGFPVSFCDLLEMRARDVAYLRLLARFVAEQSRQEAKRGE